MSRLGPAFVCAALVGGMVHAQQPPPFDSLPRQRANARTCARRWGARAKSGSPGGSVALGHCGRIRFSNYMKTGMSKSKTSLPPGIGKVLKCLHYPLDVILVCVRWYVAYALSLRNLEEMMAERGVNVDHSTVDRWVIKLVPLFEKAFRQYTIDKSDANWPPLMP